MKIKVFRASRLRKVWVGALLGACLALCAVSSQLMAMPIINLQPASANVAVGGSVFVDLVWDGNGANYIGDFDVDILYNDSIVSYEGAVIDPEFGVDSLGCFNCGDGSVPGIIDLYEVSCDDPFTLIATQDSLGNAFVLATLEFKGLQDGDTDLLLSGTFGDEFGLSFDHDLQNGAINVGEVPLPAAAWLFGSAISLLGWIRRKAA